MLRTKTLCLKKRGIYFLRTNNSTFKTDRINALRKQYDAFLEEDKRRKERNEFILGRLDKMRYVTSVVPLRHKPNPFSMDSRNPVVYSRSGYIPDDLKRNGTLLTRPKENHFQLNVPQKYLDDSPLIQEISKRFILIPRTRPIFNNDYVEDIKSKVDDSTDWKSKYEILEQLKKKDKEEPTEKYDMASINEHNIANININEGSLKYNDNFKNSYGYELPTKGDKEDVPLKYDAELPEKETPQNLILQKQNQEVYNVVESCEVQSNQTPNTFESHGMDERYGEYPEQNIIQNSEIHMTPVEHTVIPKETQESTVLDTSLNHDLETIPKDITVQNVIEVPNALEENSPINNENTEFQEELQPFEIAEYEQSPLEEENHVQGDPDKMIYLNEDDTSQIEVLNPTDLVNEINNEAPFEQFQQPDNIEYPIETANTQECLQNENIQLQEGVEIIKTEEHTQNQINSDDMHQYETQNPIVAEKTEVPPVSSDPNQSEIEAFDAEQREMFYSENAEETNVYGQEGGPLTHNYEYPIQDPNYQQSEEYAYYEGGPTDQTYPPEINDHEETSQPYDQTYEEQYAKYEEQQHYDQQQLYDPPLREYEPQPHAYDQNQQQQDYDQLQYQQENDTTPEVEAQLDKEDGYVEKQNEEDKDIKPEENKELQDQKAATEKVNST